MSAGHSSQKLQDLEYIEHVPHCEDSAGRLTRDHLGDREGWTGRTRVAIMRLLRPAFFPLCDTHHKTLKGFLMKRLVRGSVCSCLSKRAGSEKFEELYLGSGERLREKRFKTGRTEEHPRKDFGGGRDPCVVRKWKGLALLPLKEELRKR